MQEMWTVFISDETLLTLTRGNTNFSRFLHYSKGARVGSQLGLSMFNKLDTGNADILFVHLHGKARAHTNLPKLSSVHAIVYPHQYLLLAMVTCVTGRFMPLHSSFSMAWQFYRNLIRDFPSVCYASTVVWTCMLHCPFCKYLVLALSGTGIKKRGM